MQIHIHGNDNIIGRHRHILEFNDILARSVGKERYDTDQNDCNKHSGHI